MKYKPLSSAIFCIILCCCMLCCFMTATAFAENYAEAAELVMDIPTIQAFTDEAVSEEDISAIVMAGINAPSSMNGQPWHFTVVSDPAVLQEINSGMSFGKPGGGFPGFGDGKPGDMPAGIPGDNPPQGGMPGGQPEDMAHQGGMPAIPGGSGPKVGLEDAPVVIIISCKPGYELDAGLAAQNMYDEAQLLGYGSKIISSPTIVLNGEKQAEYKDLLGIPEDMAAVCVLLVGKTDTESFDAVSGATERNSADDVVTYIR